MYKASIAALAVCFFTGGCMAPATVAPPSRSSVAISAGASATVVLTSVQADLVRAYIGNDNGPGRGRGRSLPPGIAKNLSRGKPLPPGIARRYLPADLTARLPALPRGFDYLVVAGKLLLVEAATQVIRDVLLEAVV